MAQAQMGVSSEKKQQIENAMAKAVLQNLSKEFNKPKLYEVTITEHIQPDIVGFILATKKKLFCMTLDELYSLFPQQSFLGVQLTNNIGAESIHRIKPFTPDENLSTLINKYLSKYETAPDNMIQNGAQSQEEGEVYDEGDYVSCEEDMFEEEETPVYMSHHVPLDLSRRRTRSYKRPHSYPPAIQQPAKRVKSMPKGNKKKNASADVTHVKCMKTSRRKSTLTDVLEGDFREHDNGPQLSLSSLAPPPESITDIINKAALHSDINTNSCV